MALFDNDFKATREEAWRVKTNIVIIWFDSNMQCCGSGLIVSGSRTTKFDESGSGSSPDLGQYNHQIDFKTSFRGQKNKVWT